MKKIFSFIFLCISLFNTPIYSQVPTIQWQKCYGGLMQDSPNDMQQTSDGGYVICGSSLSTNGDITNHIGNSDYWIVKLDVNGVIVWEKTLGGTGLDHGSAIQQTNDGGYIVAGYSPSLDGQVTGNHGAQDFWIVKLNVTGGIIWQKSLGGTADDLARSVIQTIDGGYIIAGESSSNDGDVTGNHGEDDYWIVKLDPSGNLIWQKSIGGSGFDRPNCIKQTSDGGYIVVGSAQSTDGDVMHLPTDPSQWIVKLDASGNIIWKKSYGSGQPGETATYVSLTSDGGFIIASSCAGNGGNVTGYHAGVDYWVIKLDANGSLVWQKALGGSLGELPNYVKQLSDGGYIIAGGSTSTDGDVTGNHGNADFWLSKLSSTGDLLWQKSMGGSGVDRAFAVCQTTDGGFATVGQTSSNNTGDVGANHGQIDYWFVKLSPETVPISLINFQAIQKRDDVMCMWETAFEQNSNKFIIERSNDAINYSVAGIVHAKGNSTIPFNYIFADKNVAGQFREILYYRLKMIDLDGSFKYSHVVRINVKDNDAINIYPNPVVNTFSFQYVSEISEVASASLYDYAGREVYNKKVILIAGNNTIYIHASTLNPGFYILSFIASDSFNSKILKIQ